MGLSEDLFLKNKSISSSEFFEDVQYILTALKVIDPKISVFLFGSVATDSATTYSDLDIAVITEDSEKKKLLKKIFFSTHRPTHCSTDLVILTKDQFIDDVENPIAQVIKSEGIQLYPDWKWING
jgi:predicted nucleotidyltransferase